MAFLEEIFLPRVHAVLKEVDPDLADELAKHIGLKTRADEEKAQAEAELSKAAAPPSE